jgi:hypothetical protein
VAHRAIRLGSQQHCVGKWLLRRLPGISLKQEYFRQGGLRSYSIVGKNPANCKVNPYSVNPNRLLVTLVPQFSTLRAAWPSVHQLVAVGAGDLEGLFRCKGYGGVITAAVFTRDAAQGPTWVGGLIFTPPPDTRAAAQKVDFPGMSRVRRLPVDPALASCYSKRLHFNALRELNFNREGAMEPA